MTPERQTVEHPILERDRGSAHCPLSEARWSHIADSLHLTPRELEIVRLLFDGLHEDAVARTLNISPHTVHTHMGRLHRKLEVDCGTGVLLRVFNEYVRTESDRHGVALHR